MSWSVSASGKPADVKAALVKQFEYSKTGTAEIPHEHESVVLAEQIVNGQLDFIATFDPVPDVEVAANGSAWKAAPGRNGGNSEVQLKVRTLT